MLYNFIFKKRNGDSPEFLIAADSFEAAGQRFENELKKPRFGELDGMYLLTVLELSEDVLRKGQYLDDFGESERSVYLEYTVTIHNDKITGLDLKYREVNEGHADEETTPQPSSPSKRRRSDE